MKILFAVSNDNISESIVKTYQKEYKEILSYKNVYYFNAILKEIQKDKTYDRIIISEDLEPFANNNYDTIDKFLFERLDSISDEATDMEGTDTPIILICSDRRTKSEQMLVKYFGIGIYSALIGKDRSIEQVCNLINKPRTKKDAKIYYKIDSDDVNYQSENESDVSEVEIQNILTHYKRLGKDEPKYVESFNNIAAQYTDAQLKLIIKFLPLNVKAVLEANSAKYQELMTFDTTSKRVKSTYRPPTSKTIIPKESAKLDILEQQLSKPKLTKPVVIPSAVNTQNVRKLDLDDFEDIEDEPITKPRNVEIEEDIEQIEDLQELEMNEFEPEEEAKIEQPAPKKRGRPRKVQVEEMPPKVPKKRGRPRKVQPEEQEQIKEETLNLYDLNDQEEKEDDILPGLDDSYEDEQYEQPEQYIKPQQYEQPQNYQQQANYNQNQYNSYNNAYQSAPINNKMELNYNNNFDLSSLISRDKKVVSFIGASKNGTSFIVNNLGALFSSMGISTAILDVTKNKNSYYIYTKNDENLRKVAIESMGKLAVEVAQGIQVNKNLTVYTSLPGENQYVDEYENILSTLVNNYSLVLIDCDFDTNIQYLNQAQEIYLVQSMDVLTIQPLTAFLRDLKTANILSNEKIKIVINKEAKLRSVNAKAIIGGMAFYNDPAMSFMTELFDRNQITYCTIPFEEQNYVKYLDGLVNCEITLNGYSKTFMEKLRELSSIVYPLLNNRQSYKNAPSVSNNYNPNTFSNDTASTLAKMKNRY